MARRERNDDDVASPSAHFTRADDGGFGIVAALDQHVGTEGGDQFERRVFVENDDGVHHRERGKHVAAFGARRERAAPVPSGAERTRRCYADDERVTGSSRAEEHVDVTGMQEIEHAIRENNPARARRAPGARALPAHEFVERIGAARSKRAFGVRMEMDLAHVHRELDVLVVVGLDGDRLVAAAY